MLSTLLASAVIACTTCDDVTAINAPQGALQLVVRVESGRFVAFNPTALPELLQFTCDARGTRAVVVLPPFEEVDYTFDPCASDGVEFEVFADDHGVLAQSGRWSLAKLRDNAFDGAWIENSCGHAHAWAHQPGAAWQVIDGSAAGGSGGPHMLCSPPLTPPPPAPHVPVFTPEDSQHGVLPPRLDSKPLPPV